MSVFSSPRLPAFSHCISETAEKMELLKFTASLQTEGFDVMLDICNQCNINKAGGLSRWIGNTMNKANKILVII